MSFHRSLRLSLVALATIALATACTASSSDTADDGTTAVPGDEQDLRSVKHCGGIAGLTCSGGLTCVDDPIDSCDPANGGADCSGVCVDAKTAPKCGGIAGLKCATGLTCVDEPSDSCDPASGGADCGGICIKAACDPKLALTVTCAPGKEFDTQKCACVTPASKTTCANVRCAGGYHCEMKGINGGAIPACIKDSGGDCRTNGCGTGKECSPCWGTFACIPKGALC